MSEGIKREIDTVPVVVSPHGVVDERLTAALPALLPIPSDLELEGWLTENVVQAAEDAARAWMQREANAREDERRRYSDAIVEAQLESLRLGHERRLRRVDQRVQRRCRAGHCDDPIAPAFSPEELSRARMHLPSREYLLLAGPLEAALQIGYWHGPEWFEPQSPNLFWPADRAWCVASEIDFDSTLLGGTTELVNAIVDAPGFDSWPVQPDDSLAHADRFNPVP